MKTALAGATIYVSPTDVIRDGAVLLDGETIASQ